MTFATVYPLYVQKVENKGRTEEDLLKVLRWLTGYTKAALQRHFDRESSIEEFFAKAKLNPNASLIKGVICGYRVEDIENPLTQKARYMTSSSTSWHAEEDGEHPAQVRPRGRPAVRSSALGSQREGLRGPVRPCRSCAKPGRPAGNSRPRSCAAANRGGTPGVVRRTSPESSRPSQGTQHSHDLGSSRQGRRRRHRRRGPDRALLRTTPRGARRLLRPLRRGGPRWRRVATDELDGFLLDRGFQVLLDAYPEARRNLELRALGTRPFAPGALVRKGGRFWRVVDPWRSPLQGLGTLRAPFVSLGDGLRMASLRRDALRRGGELARGTTEAHLESRGFSAGLRESFFRPSSEASPSTASWGFLPGTSSRSSAGSRRAARCCPREEWARSPSSWPPRCRRARSFLNEA